MENKNSAIKPHTSPKDFFVHLLAVVALYTSAISFTTIVWQLINLGIPDPLEIYFSADQARGLIRGALAFLIVLFPVYLLTSWTLYKSYRENPNKLRLWVRKWLLYFTLFVAALVIVFTLVAVFNRLFNGELTLRFFLKLMSTIFVAGAIFSYYFWDLKKDRVE